MWVFSLKVLHWKRSCGGNFTHFIPFKCPRLADVYDLGACVRRYFYAMMRWTTEGVCDNRISFIEMCLSVIPSEDNLNCVASRCWKKNKTWGLIINLHQLNSTFYNVQRRNFFSYYHWGYILKLFPCAIHVEGKNFFLYKCILY